LAHPNGTVVAAAAWALAKLHDRQALPYMARRMREEEREYRQALNRYAHALRTRVTPIRCCRPEFEESGPHASIRLAELRLRRLSRLQAQRLWARLLLNDPSVVIRAEAALEVVAWKHPKALELLRQVLESERNGRRPYSNVALLSQVAEALGRLGAPEAISDLEALLGRSGGPSCGYLYLLRLQQCHTPASRACGDADTYPGIDYFSLDATARRALEALTGESWAFPRGTPVPDP
jgi:hypothetical protein